ncbi:ferritin-like domain-containing protein [Lentinula raphanica]|uniref:Ferritin-like domain-containing protein n=1 Tax=Lentinula raphanica TaxID=153919 RepID=A0AA38PB91_9AGAR|nr:ferritin-like domain-containing protein [Lentinula raphanica]
MKTTFIIAYASLVGAAFASFLPQARDSSNSSSYNDTQILNLALTLAQLESAFYSGALSSYNATDFTNAGLPAWARGRFEEIASHKQAHVKTLTTSLGNNAVKACNYSFPYTDPASFAALAQVLSDVGVSAYTGAAPLITNRDYLATAASILATEARHAAWIAGPVNKGNAWSGAYDTPLTLGSAYSLGAQFITSCPSSNPSLGVKAFPSLTITNATLGQASAVTAGNNVSVEGQYVAFFSGLTTTFVKVSNGQVVVPNNDMGTSYAVLTNANGTATDSTIIAGVAVIQFPYGSEGSLETNGRMEMAKEMM